MAAKKTATPVRDLACPKCGEGPFDVLEKELSGHLLAFVRCEWCHTVIQVISPNTVDDSGIISGLSDVEHKVGHVEDAVLALARELKKR